MKKIACSVVYWGGILTKSISNKQAERFSREVKYFKKIFKKILSKKNVGAAHELQTNKVTKSTRIKGSQFKSVQYPLCVYFTLHLNSLSGLQVEMLMFCVTLFT